MTMLSDAGHDTALFGAGPDFFNGFTGRDQVWGGAGNDWIRTGQEADLVYGGPGDDQLVGTDGPDTMYGEDGDDLVGGGTGNDRLDGGAGADALRCEGGADTALDRRPRPAAGLRDGPPRLKRARWPGPAGPVGPSVCRVSTLSPVTAIDRLRAAFGRPVEHDTEHRTLHAKGAFYSGTFTATPRAAELCTAGHLQGSEVPILVRWSNGGGNHRAPGQGARRTRHVGVVQAAGRHRDRHPLPDRTALPGQDAGGVRRRSPRPRCTRTRCPASSCATGTRSPRCSPTRRRRRWSRRRRTPPRPTTPSTPTAGSRPTAPAAGCATCCGRSRRPIRRARSPGRTGSARRSPPGSLPARSHYTLEVLRRRRR